MADDGAVYAANMSTSASGNNLFTLLYRWSDSGSNTLGGPYVYQGEPEGLSPSPRWGDTLRARGAGTIVGNQYMVTNTASGTAKFYRLQQ